MAAPFIAQDKSLAYELVDMEDWGGTMPKRAFIMVKCICGRHGNPLSRGFSSDHMRLDQQELEAVLWLSLCYTLMP